MLTLQISPLPYELTQLLSTKLQDTRKQLRVISGVIGLNPGLQLLCENVFKEYSSEGNLESVAQVMGWKSFRERITSLYLFHKQHGRFPDLSDLNLVQDLVKFEKRFYAYSAKNNSRIFLLGLYLKFLEWDLINEGSIMDGNFLNLPSEIEELLELVDSKTTQPDYLILFLWHLLAFFEKDKIIEMLKDSEFTFEKIFQLLDEESKRSLITNFSIYAASIHQEDLFVFAEV
jgi:hypothetical protein